MKIPARNQMTMKPDRFRCPHYGKETAFLWDFPIVLDSSMPEDHIRFLSENGLTGITETIEFVIPLDKD